MAKACVGAVAEVNEFWRIIAFLASVTIMSYCASKYNLRLSLTGYVFQLLPASALQIYLSPKAIKERA